MFHETIFAEILYGMTFRYYFNLCEIVLLVSALAVTNNVRPLSPPHTHISCTFATML